MWPKPTVCRHLNALYEILQDERPFELLLLLPFLQHENHILNGLDRSGAIGEGLVTIAVWLRHKSAIALFDISNRGVVVAELFVWGRSDPDLLTNLKALCSVTFPARSFLRWPYDECLWPELSE